MQARKKQDRKIMDTYIHNFSVFCSIIAIQLYSFIEKLKWHSPSACITTYPFNHTAWRLSLRKYNQVIFDNVKYFIKIHLACLLFSYFSWVMLIFLE